MIFFINQIIIFFSFKMSLTYLQQVIYPKEYLLVLPRFLFVLFFPCLAIKTQTKSIPSLKHPSRPAPPKSMLPH